MNFESTYCEEEESFLQYVKNVHMASSGDWNVL